MTGNEQQDKKREITQKGKQEKHRCRFSIKKKTLKKKERLENVINVSEKAAEIRDVSVDPHKEEHAVL